MLAIESNAKDLLSAVLAIESNTMAVTFEVAVLAIACLTIAHRSSTALCWPSKATPWQCHAVADRKQKCIAVSCCAWSLCHAVANRTVCIDLLVTL